MYPSKHKLKFIIKIGAEFLYLKIVLILKS